MIRRLIILLLIVGCEEPVIDGCIDNTACNYDATATEDDGNCVEPQGCNEWCEGDSLSVQELDCADVCGGDKVADNCEVCDADTSNDCPADCNGDWGGSAYTDECDDCVGGNTALTACLQDDCGVWGGDNSTCLGCIDIYALNYDNSAIINADCNYADHIIDITDDGASPFILEISIGESVQWNNKTSQQVGINGDIAEINYDLNSDGFIDIFIGEPINTGDHTFYLSEKGQGVIGSLLFDSAWWYSYDCIQESCVIDNAITPFEDCIEYQNTSSDELSIICMPLIVVITND